MRIHRAVLLYLVVSTGALAAPSDLTPPPPGEWVLDTTGSLNEATVARINRLATQVNASGHGQLGVAVVNTTSGQNARQFATQLFNHWGVGHRGLDDGVLLFAALKDRRAEIILGRKSPITSAQTDEVMQADVVPAFKRQDPNAAMADGAQALAELLAVTESTPERAAPPQLSDPDLAAEADPQLSRLARGEERFADLSPRHWVIDLTQSLPARDLASIEQPIHDAYAENKGRVFVLLFKTRGRWPTAIELALRLKRQVAPLSTTPVAIVALNVETGSAVIDVPFDPSSHWELGQVREQERNLAANQRVTRVLAVREAARFASDTLMRGLPPRPMNEVLSEGYERHGGWLWAAGVIAAVAGGFFGVRAWRRRPRRCLECHQPRQLLSEAEEDEHLTSGQQAEEAARSVQFDVWWCARCRDAEIVRSDSWLTAYKPCSSCGYKTAKHQEGRVLSYPTEYSTGSVEVNETCSHCGAHSTYTKVLPVLTSSSSSTSDWSTSSSSSFSDSFSSSSSSDSSSFGGGSSDGGGSSGSW